ncbi:LysM peptidoglycan-binding domain-containing protein [Ascidiaceihabitans sp.]|nr:LysM peptidoglycan-binding domain-containing protein [Ascidiaceihabitans sp.]
MSKLAAFLRANAGPVAGASVLAVAAVGAGTYFAVLKPNDTVESAAQEIVMPAEEALQADVSKSVAEIVAPVAVTTEEAATETAKENAVVETVSPSIDEVRSEADGLTILAGRGEPDSKITLFVNKVENSSVTAGNDGTFAIVAFLEPSPDPQVLSVVQQAGDLEIAAADIILAPQPVIAKVAEVEAAEIEATNVDPVVAESADETDVVEAEAEADIEEQVAVMDTDTGAVLENAAEVEAMQEADIMEADVDATTVDVAGTNVDVEAPKVDITDVSQTEEQKVPAAEPPASATEETKAEVAILKSDASGVEVINRSSAPELMSNVEIDTISYSEEGDVLLSGRAQSQATSVRVYLDNTVITTLDVDTTGRWRGDLPDVDTGVYILRVDEVDVEGNVTSRVETPFKREAPEVLEAAAGNGDAPVKAITVQTGATLWAIARDRYGDGMLFVRVFEANADSIKDPDLIYPGQVFDLPD